MWLVAIAWDSGAENRNVSEDWEMKASMGPAWDRGAFPGGRGTEAGMSPSDPFLDHHILFSEPRNLGILCFPSRLPPPTMLSPHIHSVSHLEHFLCVLAMSKPKPFFFHVASWVIKPEPRAGLASLHLLGTFARSFQPRVPASQDAITVHTAGMGMCGGLGLTPQRVLASVDQPSADR